MRTTVKIQPHKVLYPDFLGVGVNIIPVNLMKNNRAQGYTEAHWEMDKKRIIMIKPKVARVWFQIDWMEPEKGSYAWGRPEMLAFYSYMSVLQEAGTEVELNFGWKIGRDVQSWFSIPGTEGRISAPKDLDAYAASCSALLNELIVNRGYANVKYLSFYNEPNGHWDFDAPGDQKAYYAEMLKRVSKKLEADGRRTWVKIWGPEEVDASGSWTHYMKDHADEAIDEYTFHIYGGSYEEFGKQIALRRDYVAPKPVAVTEFGWQDDDESGWNAGFANYVIKAANEGIHSALVWQLNGVWCEDPDESINTNGGYTLWDSPILSLIPKKSYYATSLLTRYIPSHSSVIATLADTSEVRVAAFITDTGHMSILLECKEGEAKELQLEGAWGSQARKWSKLVYKSDIRLEGNAIIPPAEDDITHNGDTLQLHVDGEYQFVILTTLPAQTQVEMSPVSSEVASGESLQLSARVIDNTDGVVWSTSGESELCGQVTAEGLFIAPIVNEDCLIAVRATSKADPEGFGITLIRVRAGKEAKDA